MAKTPRTFSLAEFFPEPMTFTDDGFGGNGKAHDVKTAELMGAQDAVKLQRMYDLVQRIQANEKMAAEEAAKKLEQTLDQMMRLLIPTLPPVRIGKISFQVKFRFLTWWKAEQEKPKGEGAEEGEAGETEAGTALTSA